MTVAVVGAGLAGLSCAVALHRAGIPVKVYEAGDGVGGRVRTDYVDGFTLDRGFQVALTAYPEIHRQLDMDALDPEQAGEWSRSLAESRTQLRTLIRQINQLAKEQDHHGRV